MLLLLLVVPFALFLFLFSLIPSLGVGIFTLRALGHLRIVNANMHFLVWWMLGDRRLFRRIKGSNGLAVVLKADAAETKTQRAIIFSKSLFKPDRSSRGLRGFCYVYECGCLTGSSLVYL